MIIKCGVVRLSADAVIPEYSRDGDACFDITATDCDYLADGTWLCHTGLAFNIPDGYYMEIYSRSGHGFKHNVRLANCVGIIDQNFKGELMVKLTYDDPDSDYIPMPGHRIAQGIIKPVMRVEFTEDTDLSDSNRGSDGFGSSGH